MKGILNRTLLVLLVLGVTALLALAEDPMVRVGGNVQQANLISTVTPVYPPEAKKDGIQGKVQLQVVIDKEGHVTEVSVLQGPDVLVDAAVEAVKQWVYRPTLLNGEPVKVLTTIDVNFTLAH